MKKLSRILLSALVALSCLGATALADEGDIAVQLNGAELAFTDAAPVIVNDRTFLPVRAVFEAIGAEVDYADGVVTAVRGEDTLAMTIGSTEATLTSADGTVTEITMDVAPYIDADSDRTYVPVRFAAQAFGCTVGWDGDAQTVLLVEPSQLMTQVLGDYTFDYMTSFMDYSLSFNQGTWAMDSSFEGSVAITGMESIPFWGSQSGLIQDGSQFDLDMTYGMDLDSVVALLAAYGAPVDDFTQQIFDMLKDPGLTITLRGDANAGTFALAMDQLFQTLGMEGSTWITLDLATMLAEQGMDYTALLSANSFTTGAELLDSLVASAIELVPLTTVEDYQSLVTGLSYVATIFADQSFVVEDGTATLLWALPAEDETISVSLSLVLTLEEEAVVGYQLGAELAVADDTGVTVGSLGFAASMGSDNATTASLNLILADLIQMDMTMIGTVTPSTETVDTQVPEDATILPFEDLMNRLG